jgi:CheY-like chemotaxis protein
MSQDKPTRTVLFIDDEAGARKLAKLLLEREGFRVLIAPNGVDGLILAKVERPDVILLDISMPKMDGYEVLRRLKADPDTRDIPVVTLTAKGSEHDIATSFRLGVVFHVEKPYETKDLLQKIQIVLALHTQENPPPPDGFEQGS